MAVQGCEHINRALAMERRVAEEKGFEIVSVVPQLHAGGSCSVAAFEKFDEPVEVEHIVAQAGIDIGDTSIGMHVKHVQVPLREHSNVRCGMLQHYILVLNILVDQEPIMKQPKNEIVKISFFSFYKHLMNLP